MAFSFLPPPTRNNFHVAIICAKVIESDAVEAIFDQHWDSSHYGKTTGDFNTYHLGRMGNHNVVLGFLVGAGTKISATSAASFRHSFCNIRLGLVVGICGGVPTIAGSNGPNTEVLLGDVIISTRVVEYNRGTQMPNEIVEKDTLRDASTEIKSFLSMLTGRRAYDKLRHDTSTHLSILSEKDYDIWRYPGAVKDRLYNQLHRHKHHQTNLCEICEACRTDEDRVCQDAPRLSCNSLGCSEEEHRDRLTAAEARGSQPELLIHFGPVASGDLVMKSGHHRNEVVSRSRQFTERVVAFEMEGAGVWENLPTVVIKGVSDYADSHKSDEWQTFAAARAAACTKALLGQWIRTDDEIFGGYGSYFSLNHEAHVNRTPTPERSRPNAAGKIDRAEALIKKRDDKTMKKDLDDAIVLLMQALEQLTTPDSDLHPRVYWGLMIAEKELSGHTPLNIEDKISHINKAGEWCSKLLASKSLNTGQRIHVKLEQYIIQGREASLELRRESGPVEGNRSKVDDAIQGIDRMLEELKDKDPTRYNENRKLAQIWRARIVGTFC